LNTIELGVLLDNGLWSFRQKMTVVLAAIAVIFEGVDIQVMGFAVPAIAKEWGLSHAAFAPVLAFGLVGFTFGTALGGVLGDHLGRRVALLGSVLLFGSATLAIAFAPSMTALLVLRFFAGLGIGGALPSVTTLTAEYTPANRRPAAIVFTIVCIPIGGVLTGLLASHILIAHSWRLLFVIGGAGPLLLFTVLWLWLLESPRFLVKYPARDAQLRHVLQQIGRDVPAGVAIIPSPDDGHIGDHNLHEILAPNIRRDTVALWTAFFLGLTTVYLALNWLPSVLSAYGFSLRQASLGLAFFNFGGIGGALAFGIWITLHGSRKPMLFGTLGAAITAIAVTFLVSGTHAAPRLLYIALAANGIFVHSVMISLYALAAHVYATRIRATGVAAALSIGRLGAILSAFVGSFVLSLSTPIYFALIAVGMTGVCLALLCMRRHITASA
jgi:AAHS family 4-hydroxybenzoate transporter-like MFS transporter